MSGIKITDLPLSTTPLSGTEIVPLVQGGVTKQVAVNNIIADGDKGDITVSGSGTIYTIDANAITTAKIADSNVTTAKIADSNVTTAKLGGDITAAGKALLDDATAAAQRTTLGLGGAAVLNVGTAAGTVAAGDDSRITGALSAATAAATYQPLDADLTAIAALTTTTFGRSLLTQADAAAARTTLGAGTGNGTVTGVTATGPITSSGGAAPVISTSMATSRILGRTSAGAGVAEEISVDASLTLTGGSLSVTGLSISSGKTLTANNSLTLAGTDSTTMTFPSTSATIARTDAAQTFTGLQTVSNGFALNAGTASAPSLIPSGDTNTGTWFPAADTVAWSTGGSERMRIGSDGNIGIGTTTTTATNLNIQKDITGATTAYGVQYSGSIQSDVTGAGIGFSSGIGTANASFTTDLRHFNASQGTIGASSTVTQQFGYVALGNLIGATTNYGFFSGNAAAVTAGKTHVAFGTFSNIATGGGTTFAFYAAGTAPSWFNGQVQLGAGSVGTPSIAPITDTNTGTWFPAADTVAWSTGGSERMRIDNNGNVVVNTAAIATTAVNGFLYVPSCAGTPTGTPTAYTGRVPIVVDTTNNKLYFYSSGQWRDAGP